MLLGLKEMDMYAFGHKVKRAQKLIEEKHFHAAYDKLCEVRPWFLADGPEAIEELREREAERRLKAEEKKDRKKKGGRRNDRRAANRAERRRSRRCANPRRLCCPRRGRADRSGPRSRSSLRRSGTRPAA